MKKKLFIYTIFCLCLLFVSGCGKKEENLPEETLITATPTPEPNEAYTVVKQAEQIYEDATAALSAGFQIEGKVTIRNVADVYEIYFNKWEENLTEEEKAARLEAAAKFEIDAGCLLRLQLNNDKLKVSGSVSMNDIPQLTGQAFLTTNEIYVGLPDYQEKFFYYDFSELLEELNETLEPETETIEVKGKTYEFSTTLSEETETDVLFKVEDIPTYCSLLKDFGKNMFQYIEDVSVVPDTTVQHNDFKVSGKTYSILLDINALSEAYRTLQKSVPHLKELPLPEYDTVTLEYTKETEDVFCIKIYPERKVANSFYFICTKTGGCCFLTSQMTEDGTQPYIMTFTRTEDNTGKINITEEEISLSYEILPTGIYLLYEAPDQTTEASDPTIDVLLESYIPQKVEITLTKENSVYTLDVITSYKDKATQYCCLTDFKEVDYIYTEFIYEIPVLQTSFHIKPEAAIAFTLPEEKIEFFDWAENLGEDFTKDVDLWKEEIDRLSILSEQAEGTYEEVEEDLPQEEIE